MTGPAEDMDEGDMFIASMAAGLEAEESEEEETDLNDDLFKNVHPTKKRRYSGKKPQEDFFPAAAVEPTSAATPQDQSNMNSKKGCITHFEVIDDGRVLPAGFDPRCQEAYARLPAECLPIEGAKHGKANYTKHEPNGSSYQVQLLNKCFFVTKCEGREMFRAKGSSLAQSPVVSWAACASMEEALNKLKLKLQRSEVAQVDPLADGEQAAAE